MMRSGTRPPSCFHALSSVSTPLSGESLPMKRAYSPLPTLGPGSWYTKLGFTAILSAGSPPSINFWRENEVNAMKQFTVCVHVASDRCTASINATADVSLREL